jgi:DNA-binding response OmpR family regulator
MKKKILVVDDDNFILEMLTEALTGVGYEVLVASNAEDALNILKHNHILVMFLDLKLPAMSGVELCIEIRKILPVACIFAITGYKSLFQLAECREAGFDDYFIKPINLDIFFKTAKDAFEKLMRWKSIN